MLNLLVNRLLHDCFYVLSVRFVFARFSRLNLCEELRTDYIEIQIFVFQFKKKKDAAGSLIKDENE